MKNKTIRIILACGFSIVLLVPIIILSLSCAKLRKYSNCVDLLSEKYLVDKSLIYAVMKVESNFQEKSISHKNAKGLMQIKDETFRYVCNLYDLEFSFNDILVPEVNIEVGTAYLHYLSNKFFDEKVILAAYNAGEGNVFLWLKNPNYSIDGRTLASMPFKETSNYCEKVLKYKRLYGEILK